MAGAGAAAGEMTHRERVLRAAGAIDGVLRGCVGEEKRIYILDTIMAREDFAADPAGVRFAAHKHNSDVCRCACNWLDETFLAAEWLNENCRGPEDPCWYEVMFEIKDGRVVYNMDLDCHPREWELSVGTETVTEILEMPITVEPRRPRVEAAKP